MAKPPPSSAFADARSNGIARRSLPDEIADRVVDEIALGHLRPGARLVEGEIAEALGVSRIPVREALQALTKQGIVVTLPRRGARVLDISVALFRQVYEARLDLEARAFPVLARSLAEDPSRRGELDRHLAILESAAGANDRRAYEEADLAFHRWVCHASGNHIAMTLWEALSRHIRILLGRMSDEWQALERSQREHRRMVELLVEGDVKRLLGMLHNHFFVDVDRVEYDPEQNCFIIQTGA